MQNNPNTYTDVTPEKQEALKIHAQYEKKQDTQLQQLKSLDKKVKGPANGFAYTFGTVSALIMGAGMSLVMTDIGATVGLGESLVSGIVIGTVGLVLALINYPIYKSILKGRKKKYADQILTLSQQILQQ